MHSNPSNTPRQVEASGCRRLESVAWAIQSALFHVLYRVSPPKMYGGRVSVCSCGIVEFWGRMHAAYIGPMQTDPRELTGT